MIDEVRLFTNGASRGNPGPAAVCYRVLTAAGFVLVEHAECIGRATNNQAEYHALFLWLVASRSLTTGRAARGDWSCSNVAFQLDDAMISNDGRTLAYVREVETRADVYALDFTELLKAVRP